MKTKLLLIAGLFAFGLTAQAQTVTYVIDGKTTTKPIAELAQGSLVDATAITLTGEWDNSQLFTFVFAFRDGSENVTLTSADLSGITFKGDITLDLFSTCIELTSVVMPTAKVTNKVNFTDMFSNCEKLSSPIDLSGFSNASRFKSTFYRCYSLPSVTMPAGTEVTNAIDFSECFNHCEKLTSPIDLSGFGNINSLTSTFSKCSELTSVKMPATTTAESIEFNSTFYGCSKLNCDIDLSGFGNVSNFNGTFYSCSELTSVKMPAATTTKSIQFDTTFYGCSKLSSPIDLSGFNFNYLTSTFLNCTALPNITLNKDLTAIKGWTDAFKGVSKDFTILINAPEAEAKLGTIPEAYKPLIKYVIPATVTYVINGKTTTKPIAELALGSLENATTITLTGEWDNSQLETLGLALKSGDENTTLTSVDLSGMTFKGDITLYTFSACYELTSVVMPTAKVTNKINFLQTFLNCIKLTSPIDLSGFSNISGFSNTFDCCYSLTSITMPSGTTVVEPINFSDCFKDCHKLTSPIDLSGFDNVYNFNSTFEYCWELTSVKLPATTNAKSISFTQTFKDCPKLTSNIDLNGFSNVSDFGQTFNGCSELTSIKLPASTSEEPIDFYNIFQDCSKLASIIDLSRFNIEDISNAFQGCTVLPYIILGKDLSGITEWDSAFEDVSSNFSIWIKSTEAETNLGTMPEAYKPLVKYGNPTGIANSTVDADFTLAGGKGNIAITADAAQTVQVVAVDGRTVRTLSIEAGETKTIDGLAAGLYIVNDQKTVVR